MTRCILLPIFVLQSIELVTKDIDVLAQCDERFWMISFVTRRFFRRLVSGYVSPRDTSARQQDSSALPGGHSIIVFVYDV